MKVLHARRGDISPSVIAGLVLSALLLLVAMIFWITRWQEMVVETANLTHAYEVRDSSRSVLQNLLDAETGQRGYIITKRAAYLAPYQQSVADLNSDLQTLRLLTAGDPGQSEAVEQTQELVKDKLNELVTTITLVTNGDARAAVAIVSRDTGKRHMDRIRSILSKIVDAETAAVASKHHWFSNSSATMTVTIIGCFVAALMAIALTFAAMVRQIAAIGRSHREVQNLNENLERLVSDRTIDLETSLADAKAQRAAADDERRRVEILMRELDHRVGNSLAMVSSLLGLQLSRTQDPMVRQGLDAARLRIQTIGSSQRRLRLQDDFQTVMVSELFAAVIDDLVSVATNPDSIEIEYEIEPLLLRARDATTCAILLGELVTNALKHGIDKEAGGKIWVGCRQMDEGGIVLTVEDSGPRHSERMDGSWAEGGLGRIIMERLAQQYSGVLDHERNNEHGTKVCVKLPGLVAVAVEGDQGRVRV